MCDGYGYADVYYIDCRIFTVIRVGVGVINGMTSGTTFLSFAQTGGGLKTATQH
jgi:hypothetical protein